VIERQPTHGTWRVIRMITVCSSVLALSVVSPRPVTAAGPWINNTDCVKTIDAFLTQVNPNVTHGYTSLPSGGGSASCWSARTRAYADLFGSVSNASTFCQPGYAGMVQWTPALYGNPWAVVSWWGYSGTGGDCGASVWYWE
jgi:hypothetical protein